MNEIQEAKALGRLPEVSLDNLENPILTYRQFIRTSKPENTNFLGSLGCSCGFPDAADEEIASADVDVLANALGCDEVHAECVKKCHASRLNRQGEEATGSGSWPSSCHPQRFANNHSASYYIDRSKFPPHFWKTVTQNDLDDLIASGVWGDRAEVMQRYAGKPMFEVALLLCERAAARVGCALFETKDHAKANIHIIGRVIPGGVIGMAWFNDGTCGDHVELHIDTSYRVGLHPTTELLLHEFGHTLNLEHEFPGQGKHHSIMSYDRLHPFVAFSTGQPPYDRPRDPSWDPLIDFFGGQPVPIEPVLPPEPIEVLGEFTAVEIRPGVFAFVGECGPIPIELATKQVIMRRISIGSEHRYRLIEKPRL